MNDYDDIDTLAGEYVLGTLSGQERDRFRQLLETRSEAREAVARWEQRIAPLAALSPPRAPPTDLWPQLEQRLFPQPARAPWYRRLAPWRGIALGSSLAAAALAAVLVFVPPTLEPGYVAVFSDMAEQPVWTLRTEDSMARLEVDNARALDIPPDRSCVLWLQEDDGRYHALGLLPDDGSERTLTIPEALRDKLPNGRLLVTVEARSDSLPPAPTSVEEFSGRLAPLARG